MDKAYYVATLRTLTEVSPLTDMLNDAFHKNVNGRRFHYYDGRDNSDYQYRDQQILFFADSVNNRFSREDDGSPDKHGGVKFFVLE